MNQPQILRLNLGVTGTQLVLDALGQLPFNQVAELITVIRAQAEAQLAPQTRAVPAPAAQAAAPAVATIKRKGGRPKGSKNKPRVEAAAPVVAAPVAEAVAA